MTGQRLAGLALRGRTVRNFVLCALFLGTVSGRAEKPALEYVHPVSVARGETNTITFTGKFASWPPKVWVDSGGLDFAFETNSGRAIVTAAAEAEAGARLLRFYNEDGASEPIIFVVNDREVSTETEPNDHFSRPQQLTNFPAVISGRLDKRNDVDSFSFPVKTGQWLDVRMESHVLMSKLDGVLRLVTTEGYQLAWNHDFASLDPRLVWHAPRDETVVLQVFGFIYPANAEIMLSGGNGGIYLLLLALADGAPADLSEELPEDVPTKDLPLNVLGAICPAGDEDEYPLELKKDDFIEAQATAAEFGSPLDTSLSILNAEGKELKRNDDAEGSRDAKLEWKVPEDGTYRIVVRSVTHQGGDDWRYRLKVGKVLPEFQTTVNASSFVMEATATNEVKLTTKRLKGFANKLTIAFEDLPEGVTAEPVEVDEKSGEATLRLVSTDAPAFNGPVRILVKDSSSSEVRPATFELVSRSVDNGVPQGYSTLLVEQTDQLWLTIKSQDPKPE